MTTVDLSPPEVAAPIREAAAIELAAKVDAALVELAAAFDATQRQYASLISTRTLQMADYPGAFPHLMMTAAPLADPTAPGERLLSAATPAPPRWCLSPAVCLHTYAEFANQTIDRPLVVTARGRCYRNEAHTTPGLRQTEFEMREIVLLGEAPWIAELLPAVQRRLESLASGLGLDGVWTVAEDPFFLPTAQGKAYLQRLQETKWEYQAIEHQRLALASVNRHRTFFGQRFRLRDARGEALHTACVAVGLDRWLSLIGSSARGNHG